VDLSMTTDLSSAVFVFPCDDGSFDVLPFFWMPEATIRPMERRLGVPLQQWVEQGFLELSPGEIIDYHLIQARLEWASRMFDVQEICWDPWNSRQISTDMTDDGHRCVEIRQGYQTLSEPTKKILALIVQGLLHHGNHPVMRWHAGCAATISDGRDNIMFEKPDRTKRTSRIDGMSALAAAMTRVIVAPPAISYTGVRSLS
jgi:phage terminase large subunit-like protein